MKKQIVKRAISLLTALALVLGTVFVTTGQVEAASKAPAKLIPETLWANCDYYSGAMIEFRNWKNEDKAKLVSIKSSKPKIIRVGKAGIKIYDHYLQPKKVGKSVITIKYKLKGKTYTMKETFTVKKYPNPLKSVKVNGKNINVKKFKYYYRTYKYKKDSVKVKYQPAKGWKIADVYGIMVKNNSDAYKDLDIKNKSIKNGTTIKFPKKYDYMSIFVTLENSKGETIQHSVQFGRNKN